MSDEPSALEEQFEELAQQHEASTLGMWIFLATEVMFFGGLFTAYAIYRSVYPQAWQAASQHTDVVVGAVNTAVLICSSFTMAMAVHAARASKRLQLTGFLAATMTLAMVFLSLKFYEYSHHAHEGTLPGASFTYTGAYAQQVQLFFILYVVMTGMHAAHMVVGIGVMAVLLRPAFLGRLLADHHKPVDTTGLYWHFVDVVWIFLFPLLYLAGRH